MPAEREPDLKTMRIGVDLGGTKIEALALSGDGAALARRRAATPRGDYEATLDAIASLVRDLEAETGPGATVGVGIPGAVSPASGLVKNANSTWLNGRAFDRDLSARLGRPVRVANDANCFTLSEATDGAGAGAGIVFGVILGTGVGGGLAIDGRVIVGANAIAGEWGHNPLPWPDAEERPGPPCHCGRRGCIETFLSGPGLAEDYRRGGGGTADARAIASRAAAGEAAAEACLARYEDRLARALAGVINIVDPEVIVLGGGVSEIARLVPRARALLARRAFSDRIDTRLVTARHGASSGVRGAAWLWPAPGAAGPGK